MRKWKQRKPDLFSLVILAQYRAKQKKRKVKDCPYFSDLDLVDLLVADAEYIYDESVFQMQFYHSSSYHLCYRIA